MNLWTTLGIDHTSPSSINILSATSSSLVWEKHDYFDEQNQNSDTRPRLLIAQYDATGVGAQTGTGLSSSTSTYTAMLEETSRINRAYARHFGHDYLIVRGIYLTDDALLDSWWFHTKKFLRRGASADTISRKPSSRATYNKIAVLFYAIQQGCYDRLLLLDSDAMLYDFNRDMATSFFGSDDNNVMLVATRVGGPANNNRTSWNVNIGVTLWNLRHPEILSVAQKWKRRSLSRIRFGFRDDDQLPLQAVLRRISSSSSFFSHEKKQRPVLPVSTELGYAEGRFVKHFVRPSSKLWDDEQGSWKARLESIQKTAAKICQKHPSVCNNDTAA